MYTPSFNHEVQGNRFDRKDIFRLINLLSGTSYDTWIKYWTDKVNQVIFVRQNWCVIFYAYAARDFHRDGRAARAVFGRLHDPLRAFHDVFFLFHAWK